MPLGLDGKMKTRPRIPGELQMALQIFDSVSYPYHWGNDCFTDWDVLCGVERDELIGKLRASAQRLALPFTLTRNSSAADIEACYWQMLEVESTRTGQRLIKIVADDYFDRAVPE